ncbi:MAG: hypothetical protein CMJ34_07710 [Phycisphaerae bacterium]|nr:hypothetical protein [Phycisphaerae bacterium]
MSRPRFSVVTIVRDGEEYLEEAVTSVREQTVEDWELHIVDDGSSDRTLELAEHLAGADPDRIHVHVHPENANRGMSASRNLGLRHATGDFVTWLDHDDRFLPTKLEVLLARLQVHGEAVAVIGPCRRWHSWRDPAIPDEDQCFPSGMCGTLLPPPGLLPLFLENSRLVPLAPLVRRGPLVAMGGHIEHFTGMHEDQAFLSRLMFRHPVVVTDETLHLYRQHEASCVTTTHRQGRDLSARRDFLHWLTDEFEFGGTRDEALRTLIRRRIRESRGWRLRRWRRLLINLRKSRSSR